MREELPRARGEVAEEDPALAVSVAARGEKEKNNSLPHKPKNPPQLDLFIQKDRFISSFDIQ